MSDAPWTPGPWVAVKRQDAYAHDLWDVQGPNGEFLASGSIYHQGPANARLIAKAPEMAELLSRCCAALFNRGDDNLAEEVSLLLATAEGES